MADKRVDEGWKNQIKAEKKKLSDQKKNGKSEIIALESIFLGLVKSLYQQMLILAQQSPREAQDVALAIKALNVKTAASQTEGEKVFFAKLTAQMMSLDLLPSTREESSNGEEETPGAGLTETPKIPGM